MANRPPGSSPSSRRTDARGDRVPQFPDPVTADVKDQRTGGQDPAEAIAEIRTIRESAEAEAGV